MLTLSLALLGSVSAAQDSMLVTPAWLAERLKRPGVVMFQIGPPQEFAAGHIPGAQFLNLQALATDAGGRSFELPPADTLEAMLEAHGVSDDSRIVLYWGSGWVSPTTRVYLTLYWAGLGPRTSILDGGLPAWRAEGRPVSTEPAAIRPGRLTLRPRSDVVVTAAEVEQLRTRPDVAVIDARNVQFWLGQDTNHVRPGHIPGARNLVFSDVTGEAPYRFKSRDELTRLFRSAGAEPGKRVVAYCHIGQQATAVWFAAKLLGYEARLYDGSFTEWTTLSEYPVDRPLGYLKTAVPTAGTDTLDTFVSPRDAAPGRPGGHFVVRTVQQVGRQRYEVTDAWHDSTGRVTTRQTSRTADGSLAIEIERVRAETDSASMAVTGGRVTGWVVPAGGPPRLFDSAAPLERFNAPMVAAAIVAARPGVGAVFLAPAGSLFGENPLETRLDSIRVVARDTLRRGETPIPVLVVERANGTRLWLDDETGHELASRGAAGPTRWWWHIRRGITPPAVP